MHVQNICIVPSNIRITKFYFQIIVLYAFVVYVLQHWKILSLCKPRYMNERNKKDTKHYLAKAGIGNI